MADLPARGNGVRPFPNDPASLHPSGKSKDTLT